MRSSNHKSRTWGVAFVLASIYASKASAQIISNGTEPTYEWYKITPTPDLVWSPCYNEVLQCARLEVPLDYSDTTGRKAAIALIRKPASVPATSPEYRGPVLFNPGGPGGSGISQVLQLGDAFSTILGPNYDIVGFDPRGIARSTPKARFFKSRVEQAHWEAARYGSIIDSEADLGRAWADGRLLGAMAASTDDGYLQHINTPNTATDMLSIIRAHGREKLQYWGFSYGTLLGSTFASMYPNNVERMVIDGVVDPDEYYAGEWRVNLADTDKVMNTFYEACAAAGPSLCPFYAPKPQDVHRNLTALYKQLKARPVPVFPDPQSGDHGIVDYAVVRRQIFNTLYAPLQLFSSLAAGLGSLAAGDGRSMMLPVFNRDMGCSSDPHAHEYDESQEGQVIVSCNDASGISPEFEDLKKYYRQLLADRKSEWVDVWARIRPDCVGWPKVNRTKVSFTKDLKTAFPLLVIGNTADPSTPLQSAKKVSEIFKGAALLTFDVPGHTSGAAPSTCVYQHVRNYFQNGTLPRAKTTCKPDSLDFFPDTSSSSNSTTGVSRRDGMVGDTGDSDLKDAAWQLAMKFKITPF